MNRSTYAAHIIDSITNLAKGTLDTAGIIELRNRLDPDQAKLAKTAQAGATVPKPTEPLVFVNQVIVRETWAGAIEALTREIGERADIRYYLASDGKGRKQLQITGDDNQCAAAVVGLVNVKVKSGAGMTKPYQIPSITDALYWADSRTVRARKPGALQLLFAWLEPGAHYELHSHGNDTKIVFTGEDNRKFVALVNKLNERLR